MSAASPSVAAPGTRSSARAARRSEAIDRLAGHDGDEAIRDDALGRRDGDGGAGQQRQDAHQNACPMLKWIA